MLTHGQHYKTWTGYVVHVKLIQSISLGNLKKIDTMFKDAFDSLCFYSDLTKTTKLVNFLYSKEEDNDPGSLFRFVSQTEENIYVLFFSFPILIKSLAVCVHRCFGM